jgi:alpha-galactosidase
MKPLADGSKAVGLFNRGEAAEPVSVRFSDLGLGDSVTVRDLWEHKDLGTMRTTFTARVPVHGVVMIRVK